MFWKVYSLIAEEFEQSLRIFVFEFLVPLHGNFELRPLGVAMGERPQHDSCLKIHM